eukprot:SAG11_NODE_2554_length_3224_cov_3.493760_1_plen_40_part_00
MRHRRGGGGGGEEKIFTATEPITIFIAMKMVMGSGREDM